MSPPVSILLTPNRANIRYAVQSASRDVHDSFNWILEDLKRERVNLERTVVFCRSITTCANLYKMFIVEMKEESYEPIGAIPRTKSRLFAMYHSKIDEIDKKEIMESFSKGGVCRILFCTTAFGMGVDVADIRRCIHFGPPQDIDDYLQESGRTGRDGLSSSAVIYAYPGYLIGHVSKAMKEYCKSAGECRRELLLQHFESPSDISCSKQVRLHDCCDVCAEKCSCDLCSLIVKTTSPTWYVHTVLQQPASDDVTSAAMPVTLEQREELRQQLEEFRRSCLSHHKSGALMYIDPGMQVV